MAGGRSLAPADSLGRSRRSAEDLASPGTALLGWSIAARLAIAAEPAARAGAQAPARIVSLVPAVTEMLFAIGAGPQVVGVSSFDRYPPEVATRTRVGALVDPDLERILALRPDLVVVYASQDDLRAAARARRDRRCSTTSHGGLADVTATMRDARRRAIGRTRRGATGGAAGSSAARRGPARVAGAARARACCSCSGASRARCATSTRAAARASSTTCSTAAGGENVFADVPRESVQATSELILARAPDVIVELRSPALIAETRARRPRPGRRWPRCPPCTGAASTCCPATPRRARAARGRRRGGHGARAAPPAVGLLRQWPGGILVPQSGCPHS